MTALDPVLSLSSASLAFGDRTLWHNLDLTVMPGEFVAVLGPNGTGKTSLLKVILGQQRLTAGQLRFLGDPVARGSRRIGYIPQQKLLDGITPLRAKDVVAFGLNGERWGVGFQSAAARATVTQLIAAVGASGYANSPVSTLSGGEQQRIRVAQAIAGDPALLLCDEPLLALDLASQRDVSELIDAQRRRLGSAVVFVTHDVNPILDMVDRVLYLVGGRFMIGTPDEVLRSDVLTALYGTPVDVLHNNGRLVVLGAPDENGPHDHHHGGGVA